MIDWSKPLRMKGTGTQLVVKRATGTDWWVMGHANGTRFKYTNGGRHIANLNERKMPNLENVPMAGEKATMVELPRIPVDFKIDALSEMALRRLSTWYVATHTYFHIMPWMRELLDQGLVMYGGSIIDGEQTDHLVTITLDGQLARERYNCGIYAHHKQIYAKRAERDRALEALEANPIWGMF